MNGILIEAESFQDLGGWLVDTQFIHSMGSPYLIAHGLGNPVAPAQTKVTLPESGKWFVWVRTKNWVPGPWEAPGRFKLAINGVEINHVFGEGSGEWEWECNTTNRGVYEVYLDELKDILAKPGVHRKPVND